MASMKKIHTIHAAKTQLSRLVERAESGEDVIIARGKKPVARLVRLKGGAPRRMFGALRGRARVGPAFFESLPADELARWE